MDDIFGPDSAADSLGAAATNNLDEMDDIFGNDTAPEEGGSSSEEKKNASLAHTAVGENGSDQFDDIFGDTKPVDAAAGQLAGDSTGRKEATKGSSTAEKDSAPSSSPAVAGAANEAGGDKEFLDFLYDNNAEKEPGASGSRFPGAGSPDSSSTLGEEGSFLEIPNTVASPSQAQTEPGGAVSTASRSGAVPLKDSAQSQPPASGTEADSIKPKPAPPGLTPPALETTRKERVEVLRPLPDDPAAALRGIVAPVVETTSAGDYQDVGTTAAATDESAPDDVSYVRRLCVATGGFLPPDLRAAVWGLLLGRGRRPSDAGFIKWRAERRENPAVVSHTATVAYKLDLRNDCLALARRLCDDTGANGDGDGAGSGGGGANSDPQALALDIEEVLTFYCTRRSEAYEPVLCALVGPLFSMGMDPPGVSAMLNPLIGSLTLFLGRGQTHAVRDLAWAHAHRRLHDLCTYHDPELAQHLNRSFLGWEMPLPAASVSRAETSALDQEAAAMVDDIESSLVGVVPRRRASMAGSAAHAGAVDGSGPEGRPAHANGQGLVEPSLLVAAHAGLGSSIPLSCLLPLWDYLLVRHDKHFGFFLVLAALLRRREELLLATGPELRLLLAETLSTSAMANLLVVDRGSADGNATVSSALVQWCKEAEALDLATPESFRHHLALIGEIAEAEYEADVRTRATGVAEGGGGGKAAVVPAMASSGGEEGGGAADGGPVEPKSQNPQATGQAASEATIGLHQLSLLRMRTMMKSAGDKLAADLKNLKDLKLARSISEASRQTSEGLDPPTELSLPQLCLAVSAKELIAGLSGRRRERSVERSVAGGNKTTSEGDTEAPAKDVDAGGEKERGGLFPDRKALSFFVVDCRTKEKWDAGRFPTAYHLDPSAMDNPEQMAETIMPVFEPLRKRAHVCLVGSGDGHLRARGQGAGNRQQGGGGIGSLKAVRDDYSFVNTCALFFVKRGFPYVSVLEGGFAAAHELGMDIIGGGGGEGTGDTVLSTAIVRTPVGNSSADGGPTTIGGMLLSPRLWSRIGAADSSVHGLAVSNSKEGDSAFFPAKSPGTEKTSTSNHSSVSSRSGGGEGGSSGGGGVEAGEGSDHSSSNLFKGGAMFGGMKMNMGGIFSKGAATTSEGGPADTEKTEGSPDSPDSPAVAADTASDLAAKLRMSLGRFGVVSKEFKKGSEGGTSGAPAAVTMAAAAGSAEGAKDSGFGSLFRKAQSFKPADVAAAFTDLRDGPKSFGAAAAAAAAATSGLARAGRAQQVVEVEEVLGDEEEDEEDAGELFVIGDDGSEASEAPDSDFEGFDGEHRPPSTGGARSAADKEVALLEHRLSGQTKGATMVVDEFLKVPGAKVFNVTKHKVTFHQVDAPPEPPSSEDKVSPDNGAETAESSDTAASAEAPNDENEEKGAEGESKAGTNGGDDDASKASSQQEKVKRVKVRAVTELERVVFMSRERILCLACPSGPTSPGLVKSNHHLTELQRMTFMRRDPTLVTLHYLAPEGPGEGGDGPSASPAATKRNVYRFGLDDKEAFIRIIRGALQRFQD